MKIINKAIFIFLLAVLIGIPPLVVGLYRLKQAEADISPNEASRYYESAAALLFWRTDLYEKAALLTPGEPERAIELLQKARQKSALSPAGQVNLGDAYLATSQTDLAMLEWDDLFTHKLETASTGARISRVFHSRKDFESEEQLLKKWLELEPGNPEASEKLGILLSSEGKPEAIPLLKYAVDNSEQAASRLASLISALDSSQDEPAYHLTRCGQALADLDEWSLAEMAFNTAANANPQYAQAWAWLGLARQLNKTPGAQAAIETALRLDPQSAFIHAMQGMIWQQAGNLEQAQLSFEMATKLEPENPAWWQALGTASSQVDLSTALNAYVQAVNLAPNEATYWYALAAFCVEKNAYIEDYGLSAALRAFALDPHNPFFMDMLGRAQLAAGYSDQAELMFKKALSEIGTDKPNVMLHLHLGLLYIQTGREEQAKFEFQQTLENDPQGPYGLQAKKLIERYFP